MPTTAEPDSAEALEPSVSPAELVEAIDRHLRAAEAGALLVISRGHAWFVLERGAEVGAGRLEAAASKALPKAHALSPERVSRLRAAGFVPAGDGRRSLVRPVERGQASASASALGGLLLALFDEVYGPAAAGALRWDRRPAGPSTLQNPALIQTMTEAARAKDPAVARGRLYGAMLQATFLVLMDENDDPVQIDELQGWPVYAAFTDWAALRRQDPRAPRYGLVPGRALFPRLAAMPLGSLLINPAGPTGGELYRNEVQTIAGAIYRGAP